MAFSYNGYLSPPRLRNHSFSPKSPFCTTPSQLQEITMDQTSAFSNSPGFTRGRSVKEIDEQMSTLKKENFNLKLRIYFIEEKLGTNLTLDKDNILKQYIDLKMILTNKEKEIEEQEVLLQQAKKAMELLEQEHNDVLQSKLSIIEKNEGDLKSLRHQLKEASEVFSNKTDVNVNANSELLIEKEKEKVRLLECQLNVLKEENASMQIILHQADELQTKYDALQKDHHIKTEEIETLDRQLEISNTNNQELIDQIRISHLKIGDTKRECAKLCKKVHDDSVVIQDLVNQNFELRRTYTEMQREYERLDRSRVARDQRIHNLSAENHRHEGKFNELLQKYNSLVADENKTRTELAKSPNVPSSTTNTDFDPLLSVADRSDKVEKRSRSVHSPTLTIPSPTSTPTSPKPSKHVDFTRLINLLNAADDQVAAQQILIDVRKLEQSHSEQQMKVVSLKGQQMKACQIIKTMMESRSKETEEIEGLKKRVAELEAELESVVTKPEMEFEGQLHRKVSAAGFAVIDETTMQEKQMVDDCDEEESVRLLDQYRTLTEELENKIEILEAVQKEKDSQMKTMRQQLAEKENKLIDLEFEHLTSNKSNSFGSAQELEAKDKEIERLSYELKKSKAFLQEIVNKELWEKNREIEKMHNKQGSEVDFLKMRKELATKDTQLKILKDKISELADTSKSPNKSNLEAQLEQLKSENHDLLEDIERVEKLRSQSTEVCALLSQRLEELALFLDSLLKQKSILGFLGVNQNKRLKEIVENTLDLSKSFTMVSMFVDPEQSLMQLSNITALLNESATAALRDLSIAILEDNAELSINPANATLTYQSHLHRADQDKVITTLREQVVNLKSELKLRDNELNLRSFEVEGRRSSKNKVFLREQLVNSESESWSEPDRDVSRARIGLLNSSEAKVEQESTEEELLVKNRRDFEGEIKRLELEVKAACNEKQLVESQLLELIDVNEKYKAKDVEAQRLAEQFDLDKEKFVKVCQDYDRDLMAVRLELEASENKLAFIKLRQDDEIAAKVKQLEDQFVEKVKEIETRTHAEMMALEDKRLAEVELMHCELEEVKQLVKRYQETNDELKEREVGLQGKVGDYEEGLKKLRNELNDVTLQFSEAVLENTRVKNDKVLIEQELSRVLAKESELKREFAEIQSDLAQLKLSGCSQLTTVQKEKSRLEVKLSELESTNAELHNKLIRSQASRGDFNLSLPSSFKRQFSEFDEDERNSRHEANSSPDLGIESDQGRFSSLETTVQRPLLETLELTECMSHLLDGDNNLLDGCGDEHCCQKTMEAAQENGDLRVKLAKMRRALEETVHRLNLANERKKQVEKSICSQLHKTSEVLRKAKVNLDSGSET